MVRVWRRLRDEKMESRLILTVHDELIVEAPEAEAEKAAQILREEMEGCVHYAVPLSTDVHTGKNWLEAEQGGNVAALAGIRNGLFHITVDIGEGGQIGLQEGLCFLDAHADVLGKAVSALAVHDAKVDSLCAGAQAGRDILRPDVVDLGCGAAVDVGTGEERLLHVCIAGDMGQDAQFDLAVIGIHTRFNQTEARTGRLSSDNPNLQNIPIRTGTKGLLAE